MPDSAEKLRKAYVTDVSSRRPSASSACVHRVVAARRRCLRTSARLAARETSYAVGDSRSGTQLRWWAAVARRGAATLTTIVYHGSRCKRSAMNQSNYHNYYGMEKDIYRLKSIEKI